ncbi:YppG family protein [Pseudalkalibacillus decolorationis]|uniref:YppG family protein n=1 Tax=Pseudalkalibacillus decolorationis TaxID=163879 RepID=UPI0021475F0B|nr:YppG family protein [Pseudalkalibacillus decolorationis]
MNFQNQTNQNHEDYEVDPFDMMFGSGPPPPQQVPHRNQSTESNFINQMMSEFKTPEGHWDIDKINSTVDEMMKLAGQFKQMGGDIFSLFKNK